LKRLDFSKIGRQLAAALLLLAGAASPCWADEPPIAHPVSAGPPRYRLVRADLPDDNAFVRRVMELGVRTGAMVAPWSDNTGPTGDRSGTAIGPAWGGFLLLRFDDWGMGVSFERSLLSWPAQAVNYPTAQFTTTAMGPFFRFPFVHSGRADPYLQLGLQVWGIGASYPSEGVGCGRGTALAASAELGADWYLTDFLKLGSYVAMPFPFLPLSPGCSVEAVATSSGTGPDLPSVKYAVSFGLATTFAVGEPVTRPPAHRY
jgi:hypothetical protein